MPDEEWWDTEVEIETSPGPPAKLPPKEFDEVERYRLPDRITSKWVQAQITKKDWSEAKKRGVRLTAPLIESMCLDAKKGLSKRAIMARAGFHVQTWSSWETKARKGDPVYELWYKCIMLATSSVEEDLLDSIRMQAQTDFKAAKWLLEMLNRDEYSPTPKSQTVNIAGDVHAESTSNSVNYMSDEKALEVAKLLQGFGVIPQIDNVVEGEVVSETDDQNA